MERYFISDHHFYHENIIRFCKRPFKDIWEMEEKLVSLHNGVVKSVDHVSFLGDVTIRRGGRLEREAFCKLIRSMNGHKRLFLGNHDHWPIQVYLDAGFEKIYATWRDEAGILFSHFPLHPRSLGSAIANVHGHTHNNTTQNGQPVEFDPVIYLDKEGQVNYRPYVNVSVEVVDYTPVHIDQLMVMINKGKGEYSGENVGQEVRKSPPFQGKK